MDNTDNTVMLYSSQSHVVVNTLESDGVCFSKKKYVVKKYEESAPIFIAAYDWFVMEAKKYVSKPEGAEYPYWAFKDLYNVEQSEDSKLLEMNVPVDEVIFFDMYDWNKILRLQYIGETEEDEAQFRQMLAHRGIRKESDIILTNFYPDLKRQVQNSWKRLFNHHENIKQGNTKGIGSVQAGLWQLKKEWIV
ncbi:DUF3841 domain-containing protein [Tissierella sp. MSJ-40]|uniref:DUF3841 domain-containing protein n=1 Tax=Tissierella simiarum TaxID=2841534 RepID=A0ABS6EBH3_9FIRM|nr:DUF3841 domain-containing protein [Tissierella simiarum]MBU5440104.1 DUF3841 domain-containing protein [Tissierella simiarum]